MFLFGSYEIVPSPKMFLMLDMASALIADLSSSKSVKQKKKKCSKRAPLVSFDLEFVAASLKTCY